MISWSEVLGFMALVLYFALVSVVWLLPLKVIVKKWEDALKLCIPVSISIQIIFAYFFYSVNQTHFYPYFYLLLIVTTNVYAYFRLPKLKPFWVGKKVKIDKVVLVSTLVVVAAFLFTRFYDSFSNVAPGAIDTFNHMRFVRDLRSLGFLSFTAYPPGFHLLIYPINLIVGDQLTYRFVGPLIGLLTGVSIFLLFQRDLKTVTAKLLLVAIFCLPIFGVLSLQTISFFPSALTFIFLPALISVVVHPYKSLGRYVLVLIGLLVVALGATVPYLFVQIFPAFLLLLILSYFYKQKFPAFVLQRIKLVVLFVFLGLGLAFFQTYYQNQSHQNGGSFPAIDIVVISDSGSLVTNNVQQSAPVANTTTIKPPVIHNWPFYTRYISPLITTGIDVIRIKNIRPLNSVYSTGAYLLGFLSVGVLVWSVRKRHTQLAALAFLVVFFTVITQTGVLEMSTYRGRSGWYLMLLVALALVYLADQLKYSNRRIAVWVPVAVVVLGAVFPPVFYRPFYPNLFQSAHKIYEQTPKNENLYFYSNQPQLGIISSRISVLPVTPDGLEQPCKDDGVCYLFFEQEYHPVDPVLTQSLDALTTSASSAATQTQKDQALFTKNVESIKSSGVLKNFNLVAQYNHLALYRQHGR